MERAWVSKLGSSVFFFDLIHDQISIKLSSTTLTNSFIIQTSTQNAGLFVLKRPDHYFETATPPLPPKKNFDNCAPGFFTS
mmetsp:Transcript_28266/g.50857  ORF Transcript_28266/g.50857 Transcript_28266/m.50857 type:complete len:81 (-) Transcript_28266:195-437(-)